MSMYPTGGDSGPPRNEEPQENRRNNAPQEGQRERSWSLRVGTVSGIPIRLHFTLLLLVLWFAATDIGMGSFSVVLSILGLFLCVALHELGHSLVAQRLGYPVRDITLYPIGGVAAIEGSPSPKHELAIALAGPAVNVVIAAGVFLYLLSQGHLPQPGAAMSQLGKDPLVLLLQANVTLAIFNMIPAFPMDGGRVVRALLGLRLGKARATRIAAAIGQFIAILMGLYGLGLFGNRGSLGLVIIALFVYFAAGHEVQAEDARDIVEDAPVRDAMVRDFQTLTVGDTLRRAAEVLLDTTQQDFPVVHGEEVVGVLSRAQLLRGLAKEGDSAFVAGAMTRDVVFARPDDPLEEYMVRPDGVQRAPVLVMDEAGKLLGMLTMENLIEFLTLRQIARSRESEAR
ncbi:MAG: site-2 protease family protein [Armatimonadaceae bacterium]